MAQLEDEIEGARRRRRRQRTGRGPGGVGHQQTERGPGEGSGQDGIGHHGPEHVVPGPAERRLGTGVPLDHQTPPVDLDVGVGAPGDQTVDTPVGSGCEDAGRGRPTDRRDRCPGRRRHHAASEVVRHVNRPRSSTMGVCSNRYVLRTPGPGMVCGKSRQPGTPVQGFRAGWPVIVTARTPPDPRPSGADGLSPRGWGARGRSPAPRPDRRCGPGRRTRVRCGVAPGAGAGLRTAPPRRR